MGNRANKKLNSITGAEGAPATSSAPLPSLEVRVAEIERMVKEIHAALFASSNAYPEPEKKNPAKKQVRNSKGLVDMSALMAAAKAFKNGDKGKSLDQYLRRGYSIPKGNN